MKNTIYHFHALPEEAAALLPDFTKGGNIWNPEKNIHTMDKNKVKSAAISLYHPGLPVDDHQVWPKICRAYNKAAAEGKRKYPGRFKILASIPFPFVEESMDEIKYALDVLKLDGVSIFPIAGEHQLDNEKYITLLKALNNRGANLFLHPLNSQGIPVENEGYLDAVLGFVRLIHFDRFKLCRNIRFILAHTAGIIPFIAENMGLLSYFLDSKSKIGKFMWDYLVKKQLEGEIVLKNLYIDASDCMDKDAFMAQQEFFNPEHLLWGALPALANKV